MSLCKLFRIAAVPSAAMLFLALPVSAMADGNAPGSLPSAAALGAWKAANDADPHGVIINGPHHQGVAPLHQGFTAASLPPSDALIGENQQGQNNGWYCGPASEAEWMGLLGKNYTQDQQASYLRTQPYDNDNDDGTAWSGVNAAIPAQYDSGYPMRDVLDYEFEVNYGYNPYYAVVAVPSTPNQTDINNYISRLTADISNWWPIGGNAWEVAGFPQYHLTGHPDITIYHWFTIIGYLNYGNQTWYEDSATTVWSTVPAYTDNFSSSTLVVILGGRGYIW